MLKKQFVLIFAVAILAAVTTVGFAGEKAEHKCSEKAAELAALATKAEGGCEKSTAALIAKAKECGCEETAALAAKAEGGCEKSTAALIAKAKGMGEGCKGDCKGEHAEKKVVKKTKGCDKDLDIATLAEHAEGGCPKAKADLIAWAEGHGCEKSKALAEKAEGGCDQSMQELIAMAKQTEKKEKAQ
jgi:hypothetical protein